MTSPSPTPVADAGLINPDREVRIAVVLYGGVSLAIYINGVTQELLHLVRATAPAAPLRGAAAPPLIPEAGISPLDAVYRELGRRVGSADPLADALDPALHGHVRTRFVVDVLSGTSAGGINGVFLAKALANVQSLEELRRLWLSEGDLGRLLNDRETIKDPPRGTAPQRPPTSLLNSRRMYFLLLDALNGLEREQEERRRRGGPPAPAVTPLVDELDLYVTATDLAGLTLPITLWDSTVFERRHRNVFRFVYASEAASGERRNDFDETRNAFLAFAARCTSSFPVAFEPMCLQDIVGVRGGPVDASALRTRLAGWSGFFRDYVETPDAGPDPVGAFARRSFGDGGYLDNKPFSWATGTLRTRRTDRRVQRKLFYVEPSPEHPEADGTGDRGVARPDAFANLYAASMHLPRSETIREDIERVLERNRMIDRVDRAVERVDADLATGLHAPPADVPAFGDTGLKAMVDDYGPSYGAYHRLRVSETTTDLAAMFARMSGFDENSALAQAMRYVVAEWRERSYVREPVGTAGAGTAGDVPLTENRFLLRFDYAFRVRRLRFLQQRLDALLASVDADSRRDADAARDHRHEAADRTCPDPRQAEARRRSRGLRAAQRGREAGEDRRTALAILVRSGMPADQVSQLLEPGRREEMIGAALALKAAISDVQVALRRAGRELRSRSGPNPVRAGVQKLNVSAGELQWLLNSPAEEERRQRAAELLDWPAGRFDDARAVMTTLGDRIAAIRETANAMLHAALQAGPPPAADPVTGALPAGAADTCLRLALEQLFTGFVAYDVVLLPLAYGTDSGEAAHVDIVRVSPEDAIALIPERELRGDRDGVRRVYKLAGTRFANFGAFFQQRWRSSDMLWGRLDGAERIVRAMLVPRDRGEEAVLDRLVLRAQAAIVCEETRELDGEAARRLLMQCVMRTTSSKAEPGLLEGMMNRLLPEIRAIEPATADKLALDRLRAEYLQRFAEDAGLAPEVGVPLFARATQIFGRLLDGTSERYGPLSAKAGAWLLLLGRVVWGLVEIALPRTWGSLLARYWLNLFYLLGAVGIATGMLFAWGSMRALGVRLLLVTAGVDAARSLVRAFLSRRLPVLRLVAAVGAAIFLFGLATLLLKVPTIEHWADRQFTTAMDWLGPWLGWARRIGAWLCPTC